MKEYWLEMYGKRTKDFINGVIAGVETFAVNKNGTQVVGISERPLRDEIEDIKNQLG